MAVAYEGNQPYIFISYSHKNGELVKRVIDSLQARGFRVWFDGGIEAGSEWPEYIASHLRGCACVLAFISPDFVESRNCRRELNFAQDLNKDLLDVFIEDVELSDGMRMQLGLNQALWKKNFPTWDAFMDALCNARLIQNCRDLQAAADTPLYGQPTYTKTEADYEEEILNDLLKDSPVVEQTPKARFGSKEWCKQNQTKLIGYGVMAVLVWLIFGFLNLLLELALIGAVVFLLEKSPKDSPNVMGTGFKKRHLKTIAWILGILILFL